MWWQALVVTVASFAFPTMALLYFIGGPNWRDQRGPRHAATGRPAAPEARGN
ncbi:hypothetical protein ABH930_004189 [Kitasatospora sp. GAS204A]|nr:hypothetical protein [Kitasatospora sp. GAS204B]